MKRSIVLSFTALLFFASFKTQAQMTDFSGTWKLMNTQSISGTLYVNAVPSQLTINISGQLLNLEKTVKNQNSDTTYTEHLDESRKKKTVYIDAESKKDITLTWGEGHKSFTEELIYGTTSADRMDRKVIQTYNLAEDGQTLTLLVVYNNLKENTQFSMKATYAKQ